METKFTYRLKSQTYPNNLIADINNISASKEEFTTDVERGIEVAILTLTNREAEIIKQRYKENKTLKAIADYYGVTEERVRQILNKALRKLRHPNVIKYIELGLEGYIDSQYTKGYNDGYAKGLNDAKNGDKATRNSDIFFQNKLESVELSVRAYNCLKQAGVNTIGDLLKFDDIESICNIRNLGKKSAIEIAEKLSDFGIKGTAWEKLLESSSH